eukprot:TRINITY_DN8047_c0_g1_i1.p1 TRINITY_DN8047_c0_g1~~TRINITY_DN8047_c0_g1_i1.p1  ORF type:complete len:236 (+),score=52.83 TRINITY_DN8047_c0_g1_i1:26-733(+)
MSARRLLLISNSTQFGEEYLQHCSAHITAFLKGAGVNTVLFIPYALKDRDGYAEKARAAYEQMGFRVEAIHRKENPADAVAAAEAVFIGGGNTFRLLKALYDNNLIAVLRERVEAGMPYIGTSAGSNVATPSIRTTNDMPIVEPPHFTALALVPFQINAHYLDPQDIAHMGETRQQRLKEFHEDNCTPVLGLREGAMVLVKEGKATLLGTTSARLFLRGEPAKEYDIGSDISFLL